MKKVEKFKPTNTELIYDTRCYIKTSGNAAIKRSYFKGNDQTIEDIEIESKGLYCFEKLVRMAFIQSIQDDVILGQHNGFVDYVSGLSESFETADVRDWRPEQSAGRMCDFMISFYNLYSYQWKRHGRSTEKTIVRFLEIIRECLDFGYLALCDRFDCLSRDIKETVNKTFFLANSRIDEWYKEKMLDMPAA